MDMTAYSDFKSWLLATLLVVLSYPNLFHEPMKLMGLGSPPFSFICLTGFCQLVFWLSLHADSKGEVQLHFVLELAEKLQLKLSTPGMPLPLRRSFRTLGFHPASKYQICFVKWDHLFPMH